MDNKCPHCGADLPEEASICLSCFTPLKTQKIELNKKKQKKALPIIICFAIIAVGVIITALISTGGKVEPAFNTSESEKTAVITEAEKESSSIVSTLPETTTSTTKPSTTKPTTAATTTTETTTESTTEETTTTETTTKKKKTTTASTKIIYNGDTLVKYPDSRRDKAFIVPYSVKRITNGAFNSNKHLKSIKFSKRETVDCDWAKLYSSLPNLETVYVYPGTDADLKGLKYFDGEIVYYE